MSIIDILIGGAVIIGFVLGYKDGFVRKIVGLIGIAVAIITVIFFADDLGFMIEAAFGIEIYLAEIIGAIVIFLGILILFTILKRVVHPFDKVNNLINQLIGGAVGVLQLLFFLSAVFLLLNIFEIPEEKAKENSVFYQPTHDLIPFTIDYLKDYTPSTEEIIKNYINEKDTL